MSYFADTLDETRTAVNKRLADLNLSKRQFARLAKVHYSRFYRFSCDPFLCRGPEAQFYQNLLAVEELFAWPFWDSKTRRLLVEMCKLREISKYYSNDLRVSSDQFSSLILGRNQRLS